MMRSPSERWRETDRIVDAALDLAPDRRAEFVAKACGDDAALCADVGRLLQSCDDASDFLERPAAEFAAGLVAAATTAEHTAGGSSMQGVRVGPYRIVREAGRGGMGTVYLAERDDDQYRHEVALKLVRRDAAYDGTLIRRLVEERQILASLEHPGIARLLDGGVTVDGLPFFAMEYVPGSPIDRYCDSHALPVESRLVLFAQVCDVVQYAHRRLVVHRDLKPSNILVTDDGDVKLLDFGIAKLLAPDGTSARGPDTITGYHLMTPEYASPEQLRGEPVSTGSDVYSLGVLLYKLLTGRHPHDAVGRQHTVIRRDDDVTRPSLAIGSDAVAAEIARTRGTNAARLHRALAGDLDTIVLTAMRTDPERRYGSAEQLGSDIRRHLAGLPVSARRDTVGYRLHKFVRRHRVGVGAAAVVALLLAGSTIVTIAQSARIASERDTAQTVSAFLVDLFNAADPYGGEDREVTARTLLDSGAARVSRELAGQPAVRAHLTATIGRAYYGLGRYDDARRLLEQALSLRELIAGSSDSSYTRTASLLAATMLDQGDNVAAESLFRSTLATRRRQLGVSHPDVALSLRGVAQAVRARGAYADAEALVRQALAIQRGQRPLNPLDVAATLNVLAHLHRERRDFAGAATLYREVYALRRDALGDAHPDVANTIVNIGAALAGAGDFANAEPLLRQGIASKQKSLGDEHPDIATDMSGLAALLHEKGDVTAAESLYRETLARQRRLLPRGHSRTAVTLLGLGNILVDRAAARDAKPPLREAERLLREAEPLLREALAIERRIMPATHERVARTEGSLGLCLARLHRDAEAEALLAGSLASLPIVIAHDRRRRELLGELVALYRRGGRMDDAARYQAMR
ncbi:MAG: serine/threonine-protein kinase [Gemmatimonas sp.]